MPYSVHQSNSIAACARIREKRHSTLLRESRGFGSGRCDPLSGQDKVAGSLQAQTEQPRRRERCGGYLRRVGSLPRRAELPRLGRGRGPRGSTAPSPYSAGELRPQQERRGCWQRRRARVASAGASARTPRGRWRQLQRVQRGALKAGFRYSVRQTSSYLGRLQQRLPDGIVLGHRLVTHANGNTIRLEQVRVITAGILHRAVGVMHQSRLHSRTPRGRDIVWRYAERVPAQLGRAWRSQWRWCDCNQNEAQ